MNYYVDTDPDVFKQRLADEMGLDLIKDNLTLTCLCDTFYRIDFSLGEHHVNTVIPVMRIEQAKDVANWLKAQIKKWSNEKAEQQKGVDIAKEMKPITLIEALPGHLSVQNRRMDTSNALDAALTEFLFKFNLKAAGLPTDEIESLWKDSPWGKTSSHLTIY